MSLPIELGEDIAARCDVLYDKGLPRGDSTGWRSLDEFYTVQPKQWTLVHGIPGMGKSEFVDALAVNLAEKYDWDFAFYSPENHPTETHLAKVVEKHLRKPFAAGPTERMTKDELRAGQEWALDHFVWLRPEYKNFEYLLAAAEYFRRPSGRKFAVVLDPWNTLEHLRPRDMSETEYVGWALTKMTNWVREKDMHLFIVAHPSKMTRDQKTGDRPIPTPYDIHGSAHWFNKADNIICVHRKMPDGGQEVDLIAQKVRFKNIGHVGLATVLYDRVTGRYFDAIGPTTGVGGVPQTYRDPESRLDGSLPF